MNQIPNIEEKEIDDLRNQLKNLFLLETKHEGDVEDIPMFSTVDEFVYALIKTHHQQLQKACEDVIVSIFSGDTIEHKGKLFKVSDRDALSFIEWRHSELDQEVSK